MRLFKKEKIRINEQFPRRQLYHLDKQPHFLSIVYYPSEACILWFQTQKDYQL